MGITDAMLPSPSDEEERGRSSPTGTPSEPTSRTAIVLLGGDYEAVAIDSNNRLVAEAIGIAIAILAAFLLQWWSKQRQVEMFLNAEVAEAGTAAS